MGLKRILGQYPGHLCLGLIEAGAGSVGTMLTAKYPGHLCLGLIEAFPISLAQNYQLLYPGHLCLGLIEAFFLDKISKKFIIRIRGIYASASLLVERVNYMIHLVMLPGIKYFS